ncbi:Per1-like-domain-containing protein [Entophlyctis helioformis]|nr:Per1-like-domain-containing protein [Entophlyctis helioformis]
MPATQRTRRTALAVLALALAAVLAPLPCAASPGDRDPLFQACVSKCQAAHCSHRTSSAAAFSLDDSTSPSNSNSNSNQLGSLQSATSTSLSAILLLTLWDCGQDCKYVCMHQVTRRKLDLKSQQLAEYRAQGQTPPQYIAQSKPIQQFYGKWPFIRVLGMQEPASVLFSVFNGLGHYYGLRRYQAQIRPENYPLYPVVEFAGYIAVNSWVWSAVYHTRDFAWTEKLDYFSAMASILMSLYLAILRVGGVTNRRVRAWIVAAALAFYIGHVSYLSFWRFDYGYNMLAGLAIGVSGNLLWLGWSVYQYIRSWSSAPDARHHRQSIRSAAGGNAAPGTKYAWKIAVVVLGISAAMSLEVFDFPPVWGVLDAHSLWHLCTAPLIPIYWDFFVEDALHNVRRVKSI